MKDRIFFLKAAAVSLCLIIVAVAFSMYRRDAETVEVTLGFGEIVELTVGGEGETEAKVLTPDTEESVTIVLSNTKYKDDLNADEFTHGKFYIEVVQKTLGATKQLSDILKITAKCGNEPIDSDKIIKQGEEAPVGFVKELTNEAIRITLTYSLSEEAKQEFIDYANQEVNIIAHWEKSVAPLKVNVCKRWDEVYYVENVGSGGAEVVKQLKFGAGEMWTQIEIPRNVTQLKFSDTSDFSGAVLAVSLPDNKVIEIWLTLEDETIHTQNPEA